MRNAARSASPRTRQSSWRTRSARGSNSRTASAAGVARSRPAAATPPPLRSRPRKLTSSEGRPETARTVAERARWSSSRFCLVASDKVDGYPIAAEPADIAGRSRIGQVGRRLRQLGTEAALIVLGHDVPLGLVALVQESHPEGEAKVTEDLGILGPGDHGTWRHDG